MMNKRTDYAVRDGQARLRNKVSDILDFSLRGLECNTDTACNDKNNEILRSYHEGKAQAFKEILTFFDCYLKSSGNESDEKDD